jgi:hypothetical protein
MFGRTNNHGGNQEPIYFPEDSGFDQGVDFLSMFAYEAEGVVFGERGWSWSRAVVRIMWWRCGSRLFVCHRGHFHCGFSQWSEDEEEKEEEFTSDNGAKDYAQ